MLIDLAFVFLAAFGFYTGFKKGFLKTIFASLSILIAIVAALKLSPLVINLLEGAFSLSAPIAFILGLVITFFLVMLLIRFIGKRLEGILKAIKINFVNKIIGGAFLSLFFIVCFSFIVWFLNQSNFITDETKEKSISYTILEPLPEQSKEVFKSFKPLFQEFWNKTIETMDQLKDKGDDAYEKKEVNE
jgi:membrane protein required for colicin V production